MADTKTAPQSGYAPVNGLQSSVSFHPEGDRPLDGEAMAAVTVEAIAGTAMAQEYRAKSPHPDRLPVLLDKLGRFDGGFPGWAEADIQGIAVPSLLTVGDCDAVRLEHMVWFLGLCGGDGNGDLVGVPASQLAVFPGTTHLFGLARTRARPGRGAVVPGRPPAPRSTSLIHRSAPATWRVTLVSHPFRHDGRVPEVEHARDHPPAGA